MYEWCGLLKFSNIGSDEKLQIESYIERIKGLFMIADRRIAETSGVGLSAILPLEKKFVYRCDNYT